MVKEGAVILDVGTTRVPDSSRPSGFKLTGDVKFDEVAPKCSYNNTRSWWSRSYDNMFFNEEYTGSRKKEYYK